MHPIVLGCQVLQETFSGSLQFVLFQVGQGFLPSPIHSQVVVELPDTFLLCQIEDLGLLHRIW